MLDRYHDRPDKLFAQGKYSIINDLCFAEFLSHYYVVASQPETENDSQPEVLQDRVLEENHSDCLYPSSIPLMSSNKEKLKCRKVKAVLRYHVPNRHKKPELYAHHLLFMFFPFRNESELCCEVSGTYMGKLNQPDVLHIVNENKLRFEPFSDLVDTALCNLHENVSNNRDSYAQQENDEVDSIIQTTAQLLDAEEQDDSVIFDDDNIPGILPKNVIPVMSDDEINRNIRSLNVNQHMIFEVIKKWSRDHTKNLGSICPTVVEPIYLFITGDGGCGKSHLAKTVYQALTKTLSYHAGEPDKSRVLVLAPTGVAAVNISGNAIHSGLGIPVGNVSKSIPKLNDKRRSTLRQQLSELRVMIIDEISMVSNNLLLHIHQRLTEIFGTSQEIPFAGISILAFGDFYQLPPINARPIFAEYRDPMLNIAPLWRLFRMGELTEVMRQKGDSVFIDLLNNIRVANIKRCDDILLKSKFISKNDPNYPTDAIHLWAKNAPVHDHNLAMLGSINQPLYSINATDIFPKNVNRQLINATLKRGQMQTGGLAKILDLKVNSKVMVTANIDVLEKLTNGQIGTVFHMKVDDNHNVTTVYLKFEDQTIGKKQMD